jgi:hypothetical protein
MTGFEDREKEFEARFAHDQEIAFKVKTRRNRLLGLWAAEHMGIADAAADAYVEELIAEEFLPHGDEHVLAKLRDDFAARGVGIGEAQILDEFHRLTSLARKQILAS